MSLTLDNNKAAYQIRAYRPGLIQINELIYSQSLIVTPTTLIEKWAPHHISQLTAQDLKIILELKPTILILGTGEKQQFPEMEIYGDLINQGIGVEVMDTSAACRTYNILTAENRNLVAALII